MLLSEIADVQASTPIVLVRIEVVAIFVLNFGLTTPVASYEANFRGDLTTIQSVSKLRYQNTNRLQLVVACKRSIDVVNFQGWGFLCVTLFVSYFRANV